ncbi:MAG: hypothetical protein H8K04_12275 [Nitrospira sp.]
MIVTSAGLPTNTLLLLGLATILQVGCVGSREEGKMMGSPCDISPGKNAMQAEHNAVRKSHMLFGEVLRVDGTTYVLKDEDGKEVSVLTDETTEKPPVNKGDRITANVDNLNHALWIRANRGTDRRTEHASADCNPN